jgi:hypothetical protein
MGGGRNTTEGFRSRDGQTRFKMFMFAVDALLRGGVGLEAFGKVDLAEMKEKGMAFEEVAAACRGVGGEGKRDGV